MLKRSLGQGMTVWMSNLLTGLDDRDDFRVAPLLPATDGSWSVEGWMASRYELGTYDFGRWLDVLHVGAAFHDSVRAQPQPAFLRDRTDRWAVADRLAWGELALPARIASDGLVQRLVAAQQTVQPAAQLVHGDLTGNVLFHPGLPPLVLDVSPYWRPVGFAAAIVIADALVWEGADVQLVKDLRWGPPEGQLLLRALLFRLVTDLLTAPTEDPDRLTRPYRPAVQIALDLARP